MNNVRIKSLIRGIGFGIAWSIILIIIAFIIVNFKKYNLSDVLFVEGVLVAIIGMFSTIGGDSAGASLLGVGRVNAQYYAIADAEISKKLREERNNNLKTTVILSLSSLSLIIGGIITILVSFIF